jgi:3-carboxy-cis,cis-muconate cycloisomerase
MGLFDTFFYAPDSEFLFSDEQVIENFTRFEIALAKAQASQSIIPLEAANVIGQVEVSLIDIEKLKNDLSLSGNLAIPFVKQLTSLIKHTDHEASKFVHLGATSQDLIDTATCLQIKAFGHLLLNKLTILEHLLKALTTKHRLSPMIGRTLLQQAKPITFGFKTAGWLEAILLAKTRIKQGLQEVLILKLGGAVGAGNQFVTEQVKLEMATELGLKCTAGAWTQGRFAEWACILGVLSGNLGKMAKDIQLLMQTEVAEVSEGSAIGKGGSSTMPHKRNPVTSTAIIANANRIPNLVATMLMAIPQEHERSAGLWHSEWETLTQIMRLVAGSVEKSIALIVDLEVDTQRMLFNLEQTKGLIYAESVMFELAKTMGKAAAHEYVEKACQMAIQQDKHLKEVLADKKLDNALFEPINAIGNSLAIIDQICKDSGNEFEKK